MSILEYHFNAEPDLLMGQMRLEEDMNQKLFLSNSWL